MSITSHPTQSNTQEGPFTVLAGENLTGKDGNLVVLTHDTQVPEVMLPGDVADKPGFLLLEGGADGQEVTVVAIERGRNYRARLNGTCNPGDELTLAAIDGTHDGEVRTLPAAEDTYFVFLQAEEAGVDGQLVKVRPILDPRAVVVTE